MRTDRRICPHCGGTVFLLTPRQLDLLRGIVEGRSNAQIAWGLGLSEKTVKNYNQDLFARLGVQSRLEAALLAVNNALIERFDQGDAVCRLEVAS